jgi:RNA polymerase sigma factor (sigma-70 family)
MTVPGRTDDAAPPFAVVLERHGPAVLRFCRVQAGADRADDVFQETMIAALRAYDEVRDPSAVRSWLFSIAARKAIDAHRAAARVAVPAGDEIDGFLATDPLASSRSSRSWVSSVSPVDDDLWDEVARLPEKQRQAVTLRYLADLTHAEIAGVMEISEDAVRRNVFEGLRRLRRDLTDTAG